MDQKLFTAWTRAFSRTPSRREVLGGLAGVGLSLGGLRLSEVEAAKNKPKKRKKRKKQTPIPIVTPPPVTVPPPAGRKVGTVEVSVEGRSVGSSPLVVQKGYEEASIWQKVTYLAGGLKRWMMSR